MVRWRPDTCDCVLLVDFETRSVHKAEKKCRAHRRLSGRELLASVHGDNQRKNHAHWVAMATPGLGEGDDEQGRRFRSGVTFHWSFDQARVLTIELRGVTEDEAAQVESALAITVGPGRVRVTGRG